MAADHEPVSIGGRGHADHVARYNHCVDNIAERLRQVAADVERHGHMLGSPLFRQMPRTHAAREVIHGVLKAVGNLGATSFSDLIEHAAMADLLDVDVWAELRNAEDGIYWAIDRPAAP